MRVRCNECGKSVSPEVPDGTTIRAWVVCPECMARVSPETFEQFGKEIAPPVKPVTPSLIILPGGES